ncbi:uncharacterized protein LOC106054676 [Biomphalaria glabrata]|uniref:Uncharacterized protein LOC106054676 n=1 Tax=Biomphalaria glabrata TaxID=6526 RepID=A0A9U8DY18_BIOGL|nr:uncharacterized protein LOC106054676 [Biomphalaria glabrata]
MHFLKACAIMTSIEITNAYCTYESWGTSFDSPGQSTCQEVNYYIQGLDRNDLKIDDQINLLEGVKCCSAPSQWSNNEEQVVYGDWTVTFDHNDIWANCPEGFFLQGLQRSSTGSPNYAGYLHNIEYARCTKPANHPFYYEKCYVKEINFNYKGIFSCNEDYYVSGLHRGSCDNLYCVDRLQCCKMANVPEEIIDEHKLKTKIMDTTLSNLAYLAAVLGYGWCLGTKGIYVGEDFYREGDSWVADSRLFWPNTRCEGYKCNERLAIDYTGWTLAAKEIIYGEHVVDELKPETIDTGVEYNHMNTSSTKLLERSQTVTETIQHSTTSSWKNSLEYSVSLNFDLFDILKISATYKTTFEYTSSTTNENSLMKASTFKVSTTQTIPRRSAVKYTVVLGKTRTTVPYTAVIIAKFNVKFRGFLRWGGGSSSTTTNYHYLHKGSGDRPSIPYTFGDQSEAFYAALKRQSEHQARPWLWNEMINNYPSARHLINRLTDESQYEFTLSGKLEHVAGTKIDVIWENARLNRRSVPDKRKSNISHLAYSSFFATVGPKDKSVDVKYPKVELANAELFKQESILLNPNTT